MTRLTRSAGFTGTQHGMTTAQHTTLTEFLSRLSGRLAEFHHGDCIGADEEAAAIMRRLSRGVTPPTRIICHPPQNEAKRSALRLWDEARPALPYLQRNKVVVDETSVLLAAPGQANNVLRSGTWSTIRYAQQLGRPVHLFLPDGGHLLR
jgi:hypothetical protein